MENCVNENNKIQDSLFKYIKGFIGGAIYSKNSDINII